MVKGNSASMRSKMLERQKEKERKQKEEEVLLERQKKEKEEKGITSIETKFSGYKDPVEDSFTASTVGLVSLEDYKKKRLLSISELGGGPQPQKKEEKKKRHSKIEKTKLSFIGDFDEINDDDDETEKPESKKYKVGKNPFVNTDFLPDKEREEREQVERQKLAVEWMKQQGLVKNEPVSITYSVGEFLYLKQSTKVTKGTSVGRFLEFVKQEATSLAKVSSENLMFIKGKLIIPPHYSFYDLIAAKAIGKGGPLFVFDVYDLQQLDDEEQQMRIVERKWYETNKHLKPISLWEVFDPSIHTEKAQTHSSDE